MGHSNVRIKIRRRKVANLAAMSKKYTVNNTKNSISQVVKHKVYYGESKDCITCPYTGHKFIPTNPHQIPGKFGITITGYDWVEPEGMLWKHEKHPQVKSLVKYKKRHRSKCATLITREKRNDFAQYSYEIHKMSKEQYKEKLIEHKLAKWERKNPKPVKDDSSQADLFEQEYMNPWKAAKEQAEKRIRDFVVSMYDKLPLIGRYQINKNGMTDYQEKLVAKLKDKENEGHFINHLDVKKSKLLKTAQKETNKEKAKHKNLVATNLKDHKREKGRIILPQAA